MEEYRRPRVHKACDACGRRKVRCNGQQRCQQCEHLGLVCTYTDNRLARSRKHALRRGEIISKHKTESSSNPLLAPALSSDSTPYFESLVSEYMRFVYPFNPIMTADEVQDAISKMNSDRENAAFVYAFAAATIDLTQSNRPTSSASTQLTQLINQSIEIQPPMFLGFRPSILRTMTNIFIQMCFMSLGQYDLGFIYLREAIAMIHLLRIEDKTVLGSLHPTERARRQRWIQVIKTFLILEPTFINLWIGDRSQVSAKWVEQKHRELDDARWELEVSMLSETQQADLVITRQWMRTLLWQMAMSNWLLSSRPLCPSLSLELPLRLSSQLRQFLTKISQNTIRVHGSSILTKLVEIINIIADVVIHLPQASLELTTSRIGDIVFMKSVVFSFHNLQQVSKDILIEKFGLIRDRFPGIEAACELTV
ncbi:maltase [Aspergillus bombycis]|uniref:Maltase n=1 Tax=Aspergillus bombycis TaxID=109264 RepID=A0A1F8ACT4_9EURO|nr:maltase [Aspergillus bombycis]OGM49554.1 maltase [Aspergillus bombycis]